MNLYVFSGVRRWNKKEGVVLVSVPLFLPLYRFNFERKIAQVLWRSRSLYFLHEYNIYIYKLKTVTVFHNNFICTKFILFNIQTCKITNFTLFFFIICICIPLLFTNIMITLKHLYYSSCWQNNSKHTSWVCKLDFTHVY